MKDHYKDSIIHWITYDHIVHVFFYDMDEVSRSTFEQLAEEYEKPHLIEEVEEYGIAMCSIYALQEPWTESGT